MTWRDHLGGRVLVMITPLVTLRVKNTGAEEWRGELSYQGKTETVYVGASQHEAIGACEDSAIILCRQSISDITG